MMKINLHELGTTLSREEAKKINGGTIGGGIIGEYCRYACQSPDDGITMWTTATCSIDFGDETACLIYGVANQYDCPLGFILRCLK